jgi:hypothetical protein
MRWRMKDQRQRRGSRADECSGPKNGQYAGLRKDWEKVLCGEQRTEEYGREVVCMWVVGMRWRMKDQR